MRWGYRYFVALAGAGLVLGLASGARAGAADYCTQKGGTVQTRIPYYGTNGGNALQLAGSAQFCQWVSAKDGSQVNVLLSTLTAKLPSLAALAYYAEVAYSGANCKGSPGSCYCSQIGGTDLFGGVNAAGGGWVLNTDSTDVLDACIFPDLSIIDSYALFYHSAGIVRGKDLGKVLKFKDPY
jgi:putative hemolysin